MSNPDPNTLPPGTPSSSVPTGTDNVAPIYLPGEPGRLWFAKDIYWGAGPGKNKYIPKVGDIILYTEGIQIGKTVKVQELDQSTWEPRVIPFMFDNHEDQNEDFDNFLGAGPHGLGGTFCAYIQKGVIPYEITLDPRASIPAVEASYVVVYKIADLENPISLMFDASNNLLGNEVPLDIAGHNDPRNVAIKVPRTFFTREDLQNGDSILAIVYGPQGNMLSSRVFKVVNQAFVRGNHANQKYVEKISIKSPFLSTSDPNVIRYPVNVPINGFNMIGVVHYSDGSTREAPVDGTEFELLGLKNYVPTIMNYTMRVVLKYKLRQNETSYTSSPSPERDVVQPYKIITTQEKTQYHVRLFCYPVWIPATSEYRLEYFLYNIRRQDWYPVTSFVRGNINSDPFEGDRYNVTQGVGVNINLKDVYPGLAFDYWHTQITEVTLLTPGSDPIPNWYVRDPGYAEAYGAELEAKMKFVNANLRYVNLASGQPNQAAWLQKAYYDANPLIDTSVSTTPPAPDHFVVIAADGSEFEFPISQWNKELTITRQLQANATLFVRFIRKTPESALQLGMGAFPIKQI